MSLEIYLKLDENIYIHFVVVVVVVAVQRERTQVGFALEYPFIGSLDSEPCTGASKQKALYLEHVLKPTLVQRSGCEAHNANFVQFTHFINKTKTKTKNSICLQPSSRARHKYDMDKVTMTTIALCAFYWDG